MNDVRTDYRQLSDEEKQDMKDLKAQGQILIDMINKHPASREASLAKTKVEEAVMWAVKGITG